MFNRPRSGLVFASRNDKERCRENTHNEDQNHTDEQPRLLSGSSNSSVSNDSDGEPSGESSKSDGKTGSELNESEVEGHGGLDCGVQRKEGSVSELEEVRLGREPKELKRKSSW